MQARKHKRRYDIDWLRIVATLAVFLFHSARFFDADGWHVKASQTYLGMSIFTAVLAQWLMPLFFVLSGASIYMALSYRSPRAFVKSRFVRIAIPLIFGILVIAPPQVYLERLTNAEFVGSFVQFYPQYFEGLYLFGGNFAWMGMHLWYLLVLFLWSLLALPLFLFLRRERGQRLTAKAAALLEKPGAIFLLALPLAVLEITLDPEGLGMRDAGAWNLFAYLVLLIIGYLVFSDDRLEGALRRHGKPALVAALVVTSVMALVRLAWGDPAYGSLAFIPYSGLRAFNSWFWVVAILGLGMSRLGFSNRFLRYAGQAQYPFYILHQTVILIVGYYVLQWDVHVLVKYGVIATISFVIILALYEFAVSRANILRFLFGLKPQRKPKAAGTPQLEGKTV